MDSVCASEILQVKVHILSVILNSLAFAYSLELHKNNHIDKYLFYFFS